jgi:hypothetical protein
MTTLISLEDAKASEKGQFDIALFSLGKSYAISV